MVYVPKLLPGEPRASYEAHKGEIDAAIKSVLESGWYILGNEVQAFEREFAEFLRAQHVIGAASGTDALHLALRGCGVGPGDAVIAPSHTAVATIAAIEMCGALPILVDIEEASYTVNPLHVDRAIKRHRGNLRIKAIVAVHLYGQPADMVALREIANSSGLALIEDCAQAHGATINDQTVGTFGDAAAFSFYPTKNLGALGDGGAIATCSSEVAERVRLLREYGWKERNLSSIPGFNSRLDEIQAAILRVKLRHLRAENLRRRQIAQSYHSELHDCGLRLPNSAQDCPGHVYHQYVVRTSQRDRLRETLKEAGITTAVHYPTPVHLQPAYSSRALYDAESLSVTNRICREIVSLPMHPYLQDIQVKFIGEHLHSACKGAV